MCPEVMCMMHCEFGYVQDRNGCDMCECIEEPCLMLDCMPGCSVVDTDENGCGGTCECEEPPMCPEVMCFMHCEVWIRSG
eukprot:UN02440